MIKNIKESNVKVPKKVFHVFLVKVKFKVTPELAINSDATLKEGISNKITEVSGQGVSEPQG